MSYETGETCTVKYELELPIRASVEVVWKSLVDETNAWWLPEFHMAGPESVVSFDANAGGLLVERAEDGSSLLWYTVQMCVPKQSIHLVGHTAPQWGGPALSMLELALEDADGGTLFIVREAIFGNTSESSAKCQSEGWELLFGDGLRKHAESR